MVDEAVVFVSLLLGGVVHTTAGFGSALVSIPMMTLVIAPQQAAPLQAIVGLTLSTVILYQHRSAWPWREAGPLLLGSIAGIPVGTSALLYLPAGLVLGALGTLLAGYGLLELLRKVPDDHSDLVTATNSSPRALWSAGVGFCSGVLGGAYATNGPPVIIYGAARRWPKERFRAILQSLFVVNGIGIVLVHAVSGLVTRQIGWYALFAYPGVLLGMLAGFRLDPWIDHARFRRVVLGLLVVLGGLLILRAFNA